MSGAGFDALLLAAATRDDQALVLGLRALEARREVDALPVVTRAAERRRGDAALWQVLGLLHRAIGNLTPAIAAFDHALTLASDNARLVHARARAALEAGQPSLDWFERARALDPANGEVILGQAAALLDAGQSDAADALLAGTLGQNPGWIDGHAAISRLRYAAGARDRFTGTIDAALAKAPRDSRLHGLKIAVLTRAGAFDEALGALQAARAALGATVELQAWAAMTTTEAGMLDEADQLFARADPLADVDLAIHWFRHLLRREKPDRIVSLYKNVPDRLVPLLWPYLSAAWRMTGDPRSEWLDDPRLVKIVDLDLELAPLAETLRGLHHARHHPPDQSLRGGTQTDGPLLWRVDPLLAAARAAFEGAIADYIRALPPPDPDHPLLGAIPRHPRFAGSWSVRLSGGGFHEPHIHSEGWLSSAFYVSLPPTMDGAEQSGWLTLGGPQASLGTGLGPLRTIEPRPGRLALFPSNLWHGTRPFDAGERLTIAFDIA